MKQLEIPNTSTWFVNCEPLKEALDRLNLNEVDAEERELTIVFQNLENFVLNILNTQNEQFFIVPDWPCAIWYKTLHDQVTAEAGKMPNEPIHLLMIKAILWEIWHGIIGCSIAQLKHDNFCQGGECSIMAFTTGEINDKSISFV